MGVFDDLNLLGDWIQIVDEQNPLTIENYSYGTGVIEGTTDNHCVKCVAVNQCWFKDEKGKKPEKESITGLQIIDKILNGLTPGLYHPNCHCEERTIPIPNEDAIQLIVPSGKIDWLFDDKLEWILSMGYEFNENFLTLLFQKIKESYYLGKYEIQKHDNYGARIKLEIDIQGKGQKSKTVYPIKSSFMVFPNGKLKCNTLIGGWWK